uniref:Uncharacterized protein n=1 Tax=Arundo donax TaxID=35708 RepID=A0A0A9E564_ARUDO
MNVFRPSNQSWFPGIIKHSGPGYCLSSETPRGSSGFSSAICSGLYQAGGWRAYSKGQKKRRSYENEDGFGYARSPPMSSSFPRGNVSLESSDFMIKEG